GDARRSAAAAQLDAAARALDAALLGGAGDEPLVVSPTGALHSVPWSILPSCAGRPVTVSPSATLWCAAAGPPATVDVAVVAGPRLVGARAEAQRVAAIHGVAPLLDAPVERVLAVLGTVGVLHLAAHGRLSTDNPLFSDLLLADGPLLVHDLERLDRTPHTVSLAACDSGRAAVYAGDELLGLSATLATRGTAQLVAPVLPVPDLATEPVMVAYHERLAAGAPPAVALAATQHALRDADPPTRAAAAGFNCFGHGFTAPFPGGP
ncbi:CHAT domain-containing protein, partial [Asanoa iriomotensis]|uniref:CHAT domain-containing protein n=1 Tax=Asanoa iriomotensis TaxID=234613 RepID=UPI0031D1956F